MSLTKLRAYLQREGWLLAALAFCVILCLLLSLSGTDDASQEERRISHVLSAVEGAGQVEVALYYQDTLPCGAVVVADGASDVLVQLRLCSAVSTLLGLDANRVSVYPRQGGASHAQGQ